MDLLVGDAADGERELLGERAAGAVGSAPPELCSALLAGEVLRALEQRGGLRAQPAIAAGTGTGSILPSVWWR